jgi:hypothetical protein
MERVTSPAGQHRPRLYSLDRLEGEQMPAQRLTMQRIRELLRRHYGMGVSARAMARAWGEPQYGQGISGASRGSGRDLVVSGRTD